MPKLPCKQNPGVLSLVDELVVPNLDKLEPANERGSKARSPAPAPPCSQHQQWLEKELVAARQGRIP